VIAAAISFVGLVNAEAVTWNAGAPVTIGYLLLASILAGFGCAARGEARRARRRLAVRQRHPDAGASAARQPAGAELLEETRTAPRLPRAQHRRRAPLDVPRRRRRRGEHLGRALRVPIETLLRVVEGEPPGLYRGPVELIAGRVVPSILFDEATAKTHREITELGGWREYVGSKSEVASATNQPSSGR